jgi:hypothetical protein
LDREQDYAEAPRPAMPQRNWWADKSLQGGRCGSLVQIVSFDASTELEGETPVNVVCSWLGNTEAVAKKSYLLVTDADFAKATEIRGTPGARADQKTERRGTNGALQTTANDTPTKERTLGIAEKSYVFREIPRVSRWRRGELNPRPAILPIRPLHV